MNTFIFEGISKKNYFYKLMAKFKNIFDKNINKITLTDIKITMKI